MGLLTGLLGVPLAPASVFRGVDDTPGVIFG